MSLKRTLTFLFAGGLIAMIAVAATKSYVVLDLLAAFLIFIVLLGGVGIVALVSYLVGEAVVSCFELVESRAVSFRLRQQVSPVVRVSGSLVHQTVTAAGFLGASTSEIPNSRSGLMRVRKSTVFLLVALFLVVSGIAFSQDTKQNRTIIINGQSMQVPLIDVNGHPYVGLEALASALNGSVSFSGSQIVLSVPLGPATTATAVPAASPAAPPASTSNPGFSKGFLNAGIEQMATLREWHTALATAIQNGYPLTANMLAPYRAQATKNLRFASVAVSTDADRSAYQLLTNAFQNMGNLSDKYVAARANMDFISTDALENDRLNQRLVACGHSLASMAASGQFVDDGSCD
jgi:hypothetical protein